MRKNILNSKLLREKRENKTKAKVEARAKPK